MTIQITVGSIEELEEFARSLLKEKTVENSGKTVAKTPEPVKEPEPVKDPEPVDEKKAYSLTEVRAFLGNLRKAGKKDEVTKLIADMGYEKFTQVPAERYGELMEKAGAL